MNTSEAQAAVKEHGSIRNAARVLGVPVSTLRDRLAGAKEIVRKQDNAVVGHGVKPKSISDFKSIYDKDTIVPARVKVGLRSLGGGWEYEVAFARICGVSLADLGNYREQFAEYWTQLRADGRRVWSGSRATMAEIRKVVA